MTDPWEGCTPIDLELPALLRVPIKLEPISPPSSPAYFFNEPMTRYKSTASRPSQPRNNRPRESRGGHRAARAGTRRNNPSHPPVRNPSPPGSPPEVFIPRALTRGGPLPDVEWYNAPASTLSALVILKYSRKYGLSEETLLREQICQVESIPPGGTRVPCFSLTRQALELREEELHILEQNQSDLLTRLRKLFMLTRNWILPLQTIDQLRWDIGLPYDYHSTFIPCHPELFSFVQLPDKQDGLKHKIWDEDLAVSELVRNSASQQQEEDLKSGCLAFPIGFTRGFGLKRKCMEWLKEWQKLPYTSPYIDASHLDPRTDVSEKRVVGVFHELLHLTLQKKTERKNVSNLRKPLAIPQKFTRAFERHPGIFYVSKKCDTQTVILREAYDGGQLLHRHRHPLLEIRERFASMLREGLLDRSKGLYKKSRRVVVEEDSSKYVFDGEFRCSGSSSDLEFDIHEFSSKNNQSY